MELGLSLGDASKQNKKRGFCMALGTNSHKFKENYDAGEIEETALHLNLLPIRVSSLPCSSDNGT